MSMKRIKWVHRLTAIGAVAAVSLLAGCASSASSESADEGGPTTFKLMFSSPSAQESPYERLAAAYMAEFPDRTIELDRQPMDQYDTILRTQLQAGNAADLVQTAPGSGQLRSVVALADAGFLEPLPDSSYEIIPEGSEDLFAIDGVAYGQPLDFTVTTGVVNMTALAGFGIDEYPQTFDELLDACDVASAAGGSFGTLAGTVPRSVGTMAQVISATRVYEETPDWNQQRAAGEVTFADSEGWRDTVETFQTMHEAGCFQPGAEGAGGDVAARLLSTNEAVVNFAPGVVSVELAKAAPEDTEWAIQAFPPADGGEPFIIGSSDFSLSITEGAENAEAAQAFLDWLADPAQGEMYMKASGTLPVSGYADMDLESTIYAPVADLLTSGQTVALPVNRWPNPLVFEALTNGLQGLLIGQGSVDSVLEAMDAAWDQ
jgi:raffinose/stachyose/melibiose transport system substrate-binding protein